MAKNIESDPVGLHEENVQEEDRIAELKKDIKMARYERVASVGPDVEEAAENIVIEDEKEILPKISKRKINLKQVIKNFFS